MWENAYLSIENPKAFRMGPWIPVANSSICSRYSASLHRKLLASDAALPNKILDPHLHPGKKYYRTLSQTN